jgi:RecB family exonuclease
MRAARESLTLTFPESGERDGQLPSPYFAALNLPPAAPDAHVLWAGGRKPAASREELRRHLIASGGGGSLDGDTVLAAARHAVAVESRRESAAPPDEYDGIVGEPYPLDAQPFSATSLSSLGQCAFRWFAQYGLRLHEPEEAEEELSPLVRGNLYHQTLRFAFEAARLGGEVTRERVLAALPAAFARAEDEGATYTVNWQQHRGQHLATLQRVVRAESFLPEGTEVVGSETLFGYGSAGPASWRGFDVRGRIDRIDRRHGVLTLVDYKTSSSKPLGVQNAAGDAKVDLQLPIYLEAAVPALGLAAPGETPAPASVDAEYYSLTKARAIWSTSSRGEGAVDGAGLAHFAERAHAALARGRYPVRPDRERKVCGYCALDAVCRVGPRVERKRGEDG